MATERSDHLVHAGRAPTGRKRWGVRLGAAGDGSAVALAFPQSGLWWWAYAGLAPLLLVPQLSVFALPLVLAVGLVWLPWGMAAWWLLRDPRSNGKVAALVVVP